MASVRMGARSSTATRLLNGSTAGTTTWATGRRWQLEWASALLDPYLRAFDRRAARSADTYLANSTFVREQIRAAYGIDAEVLHSTVEPRPRRAGRGRSRRRARVSCSPSHACSRTSTSPKSSMPSGCCRSSASSSSGRGRDAQGWKRPCRAMSACSARHPTHVCAGSTQAAPGWSPHHGRTSASLPSRPPPSASPSPPFASAATSTRCAGVNGVLFERPEPGAIAEAVDALLSRDWDACDPRTCRDVLRRAVHRPHQIVGLVGVAVADIYRAGSRGAAGG